MQNIPTLVQINDAFISNIESQFGISLSTNSKNFLLALAATESAEMKLLYLVLGFLQQNMAPDLAQSESVGGMLERYGRVRLGRNPYQAIAGSYTVQLTGTIGAVINGQVTFKSDDSSENPGHLYILDNPFTLVTGFDIITLRALDAGTQAALNVGNTLTATSPIALVNSFVVVTGAAVLPLDAETLEDYRKAILQSYRLSPQGGSATDYRLWADDAQGVAEVYPYASSGHTNQVDLYVESIISDSTDGKGTPSSAMLLAVQSVVEFNPDATLPVNQRGRRPITVVVNYLPVTPIQVDINISGFSGITTGLQTLILSAITSYLSLVRPFVAGADVITDRNDVLNVNGIISVISSVAPGYSFGAVALKIGGISMPSYQFVSGNIPWLNSVTYV
jgi:hypothetical protein